MTDLNPLPLSALANPIAFAKTVLSEVFDGEAFYLVRYIRFDLDNVTWYLVDEDERGDLDRRAIVISAPVDTYEALDRKLEEYGVPLGDVFLSHPLFHRCCARIILRQMQYGCDERTATAEMNAEHRDNECDCVDEERVADCS